MSKFQNAVQAARDVALSILKPSAKELEHGLELHKQSLVVESYSLGLHAPADPQEMNALADQNCGELEYRDLSEEQRMTGWLRSEQLREEYRLSWEAAGVNCIFLNAGEEGNDVAVLLKRFARYVHLTDKLPEVVQRVTKVEEIEALPAQDKYGLCLTLNGVPLTGNLQDVQDELRYIRVFAQLGARMMHLTYNRRNPLGDGCGEKVDAGLSDFGQAAVKEMNRLGIIIDLAHTGWQTCLDAARYSDQPVVVSHSGAWEVNPHIRCKTDEVIRAVVDSGGTMGVTNVPRFLGGKGDISNFLDHIEYIVRKFGADAVTIGTDRPHQSCETADAAAQIKPYGRPGRMRWEALWPDDEFRQISAWSKPEQIQSMAWTNWPMFTVGMVQRGLSDDDIRKILGGNLMRVARQVWK